MRKFSFIGLAVLLVIGLLVPGYSQDGTSQMKEIQGTIAGLDWAGSKLVLRTLIEDNFDEVEFTVPDDVKVYKGTGDWSFSELNVGDRIVVEYLPQKFMLPKIFNIRVEI